MTEHPGFGVLLARLSAHRNLDVGALSPLVGAGEPELQAVMGGAAPDSSLLRRLAPVLGLRTADLFVMAGAVVPDDLAPLDAKAGLLVPPLVKRAVSLPSEHVHRLRQLVRSLPQQNRTQPVPPPPAWEQYQPGFGALLVRMLRNRSLAWTGSAMVLLCLTGRYLAGATIGAVGGGRKELTPDLLADFATVLGIPADDMAALTGIELPDVAPRQNPVAADVAELIWDVRRLTADQVEQVRTTAESLLRE
ncbi:hypothetical protein SAMN04489712_106293 [Thermomonospora echinospora]|uniref:Uncharacterized protein n=1 Tax=Thermomonospora echinospora TaxID=1992 RepID=A0A1H6B5S6_9ACTN|nr:hypothetical protein [Thermomonospora echinospora]SEG56201.1 hypothetical protein SAMN04489712_106293 [Thermomonospora echinospora]